MSPATPVSAPAGFAPVGAVAFADAGNNAVAVSAANPLPTTGSIAPALSTPLAGSASASGIAGPFLPDPGRTIVLSLTGNWRGKVRLLRSTDGGISKLPVTLAGSPWANFSANVNEPVWEESESGVTFYLDIALASGSVDYRVAQ